MQDDTFDVEATAGRAIMKSVIRRENVWWTRNNQFVFSENRTMGAAARRSKRVICERTGSCSACRV